MKHLLLSLAIFGLTASASAQLPQIADTIARPGLPVLRSYVAPDVVHRAAKKYGSALYCIERSKGENCENSYLVGLLKNGRLVMEWMCDDPKLAQRSRGRRVAAVAG